ncbi:MAG: uracil-DNA glycosylase [Alphaproteobacteria bacterium]
MIENAADCIGASWQNVLGAEFGKPYMQALGDFLRAQAAAGHVIYPKPSDIFSAFAETPFDAVSVVILGQDPYHGEGQAHGLAFSVPAGVKPPPSLMNIYKEIDASLGIASPRRGDLRGWARQGVLLLNTTLTVEAARAGSHQGRGWETFTDAAIRALNAQRAGIVFMLWGSHAQKKGAVIDRRRHLVLDAPHPSPLSAYRGFLGCGHFKKANEYLAAQGRPPIDWAQSG